MGSVEVRRNNGVSHDCRWEVRIIVKVRSMHVISGIFPPRNTDRMLCNI